MKNIFIEVRNISKSIKKNIILDDIQLKFQSGKIYGIRGKNGAGKTMLFRAICGLIKVDSGEICINDKIIGKDISFPESIGVLIEYPGCLPSLTGLDNLKYLASIKNIIGDEEIINAMNEVGLDPYDKKKVKKYSLGMRQRLGIAQAIMENPDILILDEPINALDEDGVEDINNILKRFRNEGKIVIMSSHDKEELEYICDEIIVMKNGKIIKNATENKV